ncbi:MAG: 1-acyl-sn-glycerol-3-phosphate acyltransferase [Gammaproteobacteria bacterium]|nr:1-acyl-sn-glycerol-3-phosphate acyltransferase [Gammaproteobacteria bacterium]
MKLMSQQPTLNPSANRFKIWWIIIYSLANTLKYSLKTMFIGLLVNRKDKLAAREKVNQIIYDWASRLVNKAQIDWRVDGELEVQIPEERSVILMCNHASAYDIPLAYTALPGAIRMIAKKELFNIPILSRAMRTAEFPSIDRQNRTQAIKDLEFARNKMKSGIRIWMFPEGTRSADGQLRPLKKGGIRLAIDTNAIVIPIVMQDIQHILPNKKWLKMRLGQKVNIKIGQAIDCRQYQIDDRHQLTELVYNQMQQLLESR